jgi:hypothetical protein
MVQDQIKIMAKAHSGSRLFVLSHVETHSKRKTYSIKNNSQKTQEIKKEGPEKCKEQVIDNVRKRKCFMKDKVLEQDQNKTLAKAHSGSQLIVLCCREFRANSVFAQKRIYTHTNIQYKIRLRKKENR